MDTGLTTQLRTGLPSSPHCPSFPIEDPQAAATSSVTTSVFTPYMQQRGQGTAVPVDRTASLKLNTAIRRTLGFNLFSMAGTLYSAFQFISLNSSLALFRLACCGFAVLGSNLYLFSLLRRQGQSGFIPPDITDRHLSVTNRTKTGNPEDDRKHFMELRATDIDRQVHGADPVVKETLVKFFVAYDMLRLGWPSEFGDFSPGKPYTVLTHTRFKQAVLSTIQKYAVEDHLNLSEAQQKQVVNEARRLHYLSFLHEGEGRLLPGDARVLKTTKAIAIIVGVTSIITAIPAAVANPGVLMNLELFIRSYPWQITGLFGSLNLFLAPLLTSSLKKQGVIEQRAAAALSSVDLPTEERRMLIADLLSYASSKRLGQAASAECLTSARQLCKDVEECDGFLFEMLKMLESEKDPFAKTRILSQILNLQRGYKDLSARHPSRANYASVLEAQLMGLSIGPASDELAIEITRALGSCNPDGSNMLPARITSQQLTISFHHAAENRWTGANYFLRAAHRYASREFLERLLTIAETRQDEVLDYTFRVIPDTSPIVVAPRQRTTIYRAIAQMWKMRKDEDPDLQERVANVFSDLIHDFNPQIQCLVVELADDVFPNPLDILRAMSNPANYLICKRAREDAANKLILNAQRLNLPGLLRL